MVDLKVCVAVKRSTDKKDYPCCGFWEKGNGKLGFICIAEMMSAIYLAYLAKYCCKVTPTLPISFSA